MPTFCTASSPELLATVKTVTSILAAPVAAFTFWLGYKQKERERTLSYYHKVVVDVTIPTIFKFFDEQVKLLTTAAEEAKRSSSTTRRTLPRPAHQALTTFSTALFQLQDEITDRTIIFDEKVTEKIRLGFETIQNEATCWFSDILQRKPRSVEEVKIILQTGQRRLIKQLYEGQFRTY